MTTLAERIDALLPQTQCTRCGFPTCRDYANAIAGGQAEINQCPPGGAAGIAALADFLERVPLPLNPANGAEKPRDVAFIDEDACIGCTKCIQACPVDAIVGAAKFMHTVIADECTGCELCVAPCPVDCIAMVPAKTAADAEKYRGRFTAHQGRLARREAERAAELAARKTRVDAGDAVAAALARARAKKAVGT
ncbi:MAG: electron transport complex subunit RsxB [Proteobacteria bacterium]|nr:electron transport complex subunit RsxB [Pseudomonadota bacterium]